MLLIIDDLPYVWGEYQAQVINILPFYYFEMIEFVEKDANNQNEMSNINTEKGIINHNKHFISDDKIIMAELKEFIDDGDLQNRKKNEQFLETNLQKNKNGFEKKVENWSIEPKKSQNDLENKLGMNFYQEIKEEPQPIKISKRVKCINEKDCYLHFLPFVLKSIHDLFFKLEVNCLKKVF